MKDDFLEEARIFWLNAASASRTSNQRGVIRPVTLENNQTCFGITIGQSWVVGGDGTLTTFDTRQAARRFLDLLGLGAGSEDVGGKPCPRPFLAHYETFHLLNHKLHPCERTSPGDGDDFDRTHLQTKVDKRSAGKQALQARIMHFAMSCCLGHLATHPRSVSAF